MNDLDPTLTLATMDIAPMLMPNGWDVRRESPNTYEDCVRTWTECGKICVSDYFGPELIFGAPDCSYAFNAWHDWCHVTLSARFDREGERKVNECMQSHLFKWWTTSKVPVTEPAYFR